jgi:hypothetical protein
MPNDSTSSCERKVVLSGAVWGSSRKALPITTVSGKTSVAVGFWGSSAEAGRNGQASKAVRVEARNRRGKKGLDFIICAIVQIRKQVCGSLDKPFF